MGRCGLGKKKQATMNSLLRGTPQQDWMVVAQKTISGNKPNSSFFRINLQQIIMK